MPSLNEFLVGAVSFILILLGAAGSVLPILPGPPLAFGGLWLYGWYTNYQTLTPTVLIIFAVLTLLTFVVDMVSPAVGAGGSKASRYGIIGSIIGTFLGMFVLGPIGLVVGPFVGAFLGELAYAQNYEQAIAVAKGSFAGFVIGSVFKIAVILSMLGYFIFALFQ